MIELDGLTVAGLAAVAALAGFVDAIAGGGGLLTVPALLTAGLPPPLALGTNKGQSIFGSTAALLRFYRSPLLDRGRAVLSFAAGLAGAIMGALLLRRVPNDALRPLVLGLLVVAVLAVLLPQGAPQEGARPRSRGLAALVATTIGAYDGFFGPGTGTFLIVAYTRLWREPMAVASANAKAVNCASNWGSLLVFALSGWVVWPIALAMGVGQLAGGWTGAHLVVRRGHGLVRAFVVAVSLALVARLVWQTLS